MLWNGRPIECRPCSEETFSTPATPVIPTGLGDTHPIGDGILTGADEKQEWLLPWWHENIRKHNADLPVAFADFGLSPEFRGWCYERGQVLEVPKVSGLTWHRKPFAILSSSFHRTLWMDADCEVRGDLSVIFPYADKGIGVTHDLHTRSCHRPGAVATGMVARTHGDPTTEEWAKEILLREYRGDQEAFNAIREFIRLWRTSPIASPSCLSLSAIASSDGGPLPAPAP